MAGQHRIFQIYLIAGGIIWVERRKIMPGARPGNFHREKAYADVADKITPTMAVAAVIAMLFHTQTKNSFSTNTVR